MRDVLDELVGWWQAGETVGMGTVVATWRSAPRPAGASMLVGPDGTAVGSVSGGCVEGAVYEEARDVVETGEPTLERYGVSDDDAFAVGLTCGGVLDVYVESVSRESFPELGEIAASVGRGEPVAVVTVVRGPADRLGRRLVLWPDRTSGSLGLARLDDAVADDARGMLAAGRTATLTYGHDGERRGDELTLFVSSFAPRARMIVFGAIDFAAACARVGAFLGYTVTVCDARPVFATARRFPDAHEVVVEWPHRYLRAEVDAGRVDERTVLCVLTHDPKFDVPLLEVALRVPVAYVGAMGSRRTHDERLARLAEAGMTPAELGRLSSPIGLDLGARTPEETAISIAAEIIAGRWGGTGERLTGVGGPIHRTADR
ncbi:XshC-Cox1 family protein [Modestobacter sp. I12A-02628]|uniref:XdhC family protein n=1 Tax=Goekera deserti TaxID=2497753 RepID=A0A7K3WLN2_9ACTN|nr:XdhC/CoxI family protein [Goekera deserti]MPQ98967.1 XshC-Cox1 family protein [Goekera deserti]NDI50571.1 XshC-Cox1 family protein [Goekera deserti]NEL56640.1 XdhC family protein [Goekera deserti]